MACARQVVLDTGANELMLDVGFAQAGRVDVGAMEAAEFAGGARGALRHGRAASRRLGGFTLGEVPLLIAGLRTSLAPFFTETAVDGALGVGALRHLLAIIDYPGARLRLQRRDARPPPASRFPSERRRRATAPAARSHPRGSMHSTSVRWRHAEWRAR